MIRIQHLYISPGHNYFGHAGQASGNHPILEVDQIECVAGHGIRGDRFYDFKPDYKGQITFFAIEVFDRLQSELNLSSEASPAGTRRNVITAGEDLNSLVGKEFEIQGVFFLGVEECRPCYWMNESFRDPKVEEWLKGRGGLRARILSDGTLERTLKL